MIAKVQICTVRDSAYNIWKKKNARDKERLLDIAQRKNNKE
jgi:hypothetical protein